MDKAYLIYTSSDEEKAILLESCSSLEELKDAIRAYPKGPVVFEYDNKFVSLERFELLNPVRRHDLERS